MMRRQRAALSTEGKRVRRARSDGVDIVNYITCLLNIVQQRSCGTLLYNSSLNVYIFLLYHLFVEHCSNYPKVRLKKVKSKLKLGNFKSSFSSAFRCFASKPAQNSRIFA
jgi:hypothetical protein